VAKPSKALLSTIGRPVRDEYRREIGQVVSFTVNPYGHVDEILVKHGDGRFHYYHSDQMRVNGDGEVVLSSGFKLKADALCEDIPLIWRKDQVLDGLLKDERILPETYKCLHQEFSDELKKLKSEAQATMDRIDEQLHACAELFRRLHSAKTYLEIEHAIGEVDGDSYKESLQTITDGLRCAVDERTDLEAMKKRLSNLLLGEAPEIEGTPPVEESPEEEPATEEMPPALEEPPQPTEEPDLSEGTVPPQEPTITVHGVGRFRPKPKSLG